MGLRITIHRTERDASYIRVTAPGIAAPLKVRVRRSNKSGDVELEFDGPRDFAIDRHRAEEGAPPATLR